MRVRGDTDIDTMALRQALEALKSLPGGPLPSPEEMQAPQEDPMQMAQAGPSPDEAQSAIDRMLGRGQPEASPAPAPEEPMPSPEAEQGNGLFGGKKTRQEQLDEELKRQMGQ